MRSGRRVSPTNWTRIGEDTGIPPMRRRCSRGAPTRPHEPPPPRRGGGRRCDVGVAARDTTGAHARAETARGRRCGTGAGAGALDTRHALGCCGGTLRRARSRISVAARRRSSCWGWRLAQYRQIDRQQDAEGLGRFTVGATDHPVSRTSPVPIGTSTAMFSASAVQHFHS